MSRIRTIKPDFWTDGVITSISPFARLLYIGTWNFTLCDHGHLADDASKLKLQVLPGDDVDIHELLGELMDSGRIVRLSGPDGRTFLHIKRFQDHQKVDPRWSSRCPACSLLNSGELTETHRSFSKLPGTPLNSVQERKGKDGIGEERKEELPSSPPARIDRFPEFWAHFPRKVGKGSAAKAFSAATKRAPATEIIQAAARYALDPNLPEAHFIPHAATWLNRDSWQDEPEAPRRPPERAGSAGQQMSTGTQRAMAAVEAARQVSESRNQLQLGVS